MVSLRMPPALIALVAAALVMPAWLYYQNIGGGGGPGRFFIPSVAAAALSTASLVLWLGGGGVAAGAAAGCLLMLAVSAWIALARIEPSRNATAAPPFRRLTESDRIISRLINAVNHDMRSLELARWFIAQLASSAADGQYACGKGDSLDVAAIAAKVPGANEVTRAELAAHLGDLVREACARKPQTPREFAAVLREFGDSAYHPVHGILKGMPGYSVGSSVPLPP